MILDSYSLNTCSRQGRAFALAVSKGYSGLYFAMRFLQSETAKYIDDTNNTFNFLSPKEMYEFVLEQFPSIEAKPNNGDKQDVFYWIGYIYRAWSIIDKKKSNELLKMISPKEMVDLYDTFHTLSVEETINRLDELSKTSEIDGYELYKKIKTENKKLKK